MNTSAEISPPGPAIAAITRTPWLGLLAFLVILSWRPVAHSAMMLMHEAFHGPVRLLASFTVGAIGIVVMWRGMKKDEVTGSLMGFLAGSLIWTGWAEESFNSFAALMQVQPLQWQGFTLFTPGLLMIESSVVLMLMLVIMMGSNKDTHCRMFMWFHRNLRIWPDRRTPGYKRQYARIACLEYLFVVWFFYVFNILIFDPRLLGPDSMITAGILLLLMIWGSYLLWKLTRLRAAGPALRYAIPTVGCWWVLVESGAAMGLFPEFWIRPMEYPLIMSTVALACLLIILTYRSLRPAPATAPA